MLTFQNFIAPFKSDLGENIVEHARISKNAIINFINPVTGSLETISITHEDYTTDPIVKVIYIPHESSYWCGEEIEVDNLSDLYDFILIEEQ